MTCTIGTRYKGKRRMRTQPYASALNEKSSEYIPMTEEFYYLLITLWGVGLWTLINDEEFINKNTSGSLPFSYTVCHKQILVLIFIPIANLLSGNN